MVDYGVLCGSERDFWGEGGMMDRRIIEWDGLVRVLWFCGVGELVGWEIISVRLFGRGFVVYISMGSCYIFLNIFFKVRSVFVCIYRVVKDWDRKIIGVCCL